MENHHRAAIHLTKNYFNPPVCKLILKNRNKTDDGIQGVFLLLQNCPGHPVR